MMGWILGPLFLPPVGLAWWSRTEPRRAFGTAFSLQIVVLAVVIALSGLLGLSAWPRCCSGPFGRLCYSGEIIEPCSRFRISQKTDDLSTSVISDSTPSPEHRDSISSAVRRPARKPSLHTMTPSRVAA